MDGWQPVVRTGGKANSDGNVAGRAWEGAKQVKMAAEEYLCFLRPVASVIGQTRSPWLV